MKMLAYQIWHKCEFSNSNYSPALGLIDSYYSPVLGLINSYYSPAIGLITLIIVLSLAWLTPIVALPLAWFYGVNNIEFTFHQDAFVINLNSSGSWEKDLHNSLNISLHHTTLSPFCCPISTPGGKAQGERSLQTLI